MTGWAPPPRLCACGCGQVAWRWGLSQGCANALAGMCLGKTRFRTEQRARKRSHGHRRGEVQRAYRCQVCCYIHIGRADTSAWTAWKRQRVLDGLKRAGKSELLHLLAAGFDGMDRAEWKQNGWRSS